MIMQKPGRFLSLLYEFRSTEIKHNTQRQGDTLNSKKGIRFVCIDKDEGMFTRALQNSPYGVPHPDLIATLAKRRSLG